MSELMSLVDAESMKMLLAIFFVLALSAWAGSAVARRQKKVDPAKEEGLQIVLGALPTASAQAQAEALLHQYLAARIAFYHEEDYDQRMALRMQSIELQTKMWNFVSAAAKQSPNQLTMSLVALEPGSTEGHAVQRRACSIGLLRW